MSKDFQQLLHQRNSFRSFCVIGMFGMLPMLTIFLSLVCFFVCFFKLQVTSIFLFRLVSLFLSTYLSFFCLFISIFCFFLSFFLSFFLFFFLSFPFFLPFPPYYYSVFSSFATKPIVIFGFCSFDWERRNLVKGCQLKVPRLKIHKSLN